MIYKLKDNDNAGRRNEMKELIIRVDEPGERAWDGSPKTFETQELVRCKDCCYAESFIESYKCYFDEENESGCKRSHDANFFCAYGERKQLKDNNEGGRTMKFRKKPVVIEAYQTDKPLDIETLEGTMHADPGDWIITGVHGEQYPCKPDIFALTYEPVEG